MAMAAASSSRLFFLPPSFASFASFASPCAPPSSSSSSESESIRFPWLKSPRGALLQASAKKKKKKSSSSNGSSGSKGGSRRDRDPVDPHESLGFFPEGQAILLRKKAVQEEAQPLPQFADAEQEELYQSLSLELESSLKLERMRHYEVVFLIHENHDDQVEEIVTKVEDFIRDKKGRIWRLNDWGLRRLAYEVKKALEAHYILMNFEIDAKFINDFITMLDKDERVIRHMVTKQDKAETEYSPPPMDYQTLLAKQGLADDDDGFWDDDDDYTMYNDRNADADDDDEAYEDDSDAASGEEDGEVIYVDGDGEEDTDDITDMKRKVENITRLA